MKFYWIKTNAFIKSFFSKYTWAIPNNSKTVFLTFDDGPTEEITTWTLAQLAKHEAKATFFCIGKNIDRNPEIFSEIIKKGHAIGNHTYNHQNGWQTKTENYLANSQLCEIAIHKQDPDFFKLQSKLFRPPYGKIKTEQAKKLIQMGYKIIMWDVLSADFDPNISPEKCWKNVASNLTSGSIIVFHDSQKAFANLEYVLPRTLALIKEKGYQTAVIR